MRIAKNKMPKVTPDLETYLERHPEEILTALHGFADHLATDGAESPITLGHLLLIEHHLEHIRYRCERGYEDATALIATFQNAIVEFANAKRLDGPALTMLAGVLHHTGIRPTPGLSAAITQSVKELPPQSGPAQMDFAPMLATVVAECGGDPFQVASILSESAHALPVQARAAMVTDQIRSNDAVVLEAAVLLILNPEPEARRTATQELLKRIEKLSPNSLRRLIAMRNWCPEAEQSSIDALVRAARTKGIACAGWQKASVERILASSIDGSGAQGFLIVTRDGNKQRLSSILLKKGVRDAWSTPAGPRRAVAETVNDASEETILLPVSRGFFDHAVRHHLRLGLAAGQLPPAGLLQVAETIGGADWQPRLIDWSGTLARVVSELPAGMLEPGKVTAVLRDSATWADFETITESWFEDDQDVARVATAGGPRALAKTAEYVLQTVLERRREKWAEMFLWTALWLREAGAPQAPPWENFAVLAHAMAEGRDLAGISLMREIATKTVMAFANRQ